MGLRTFSVNFLQGLRRLGFVNGSDRAGHLAALSRRADSLRKISRRMELARRQPLDPVLAHKLELLRNRH
jgi:hypothetical protein